MVVKRKAKAKTKVMNGRKYKLVKVQRGNGLWDSVWKAVKKGAKRTGKFIKKNHLVSGALDIAGDIGIPNAGFASKGVRQLGYGKTRHAVPTKRGSIVF